MAGYKGATLNPTNKKFSFSLFSGLNKELRHTLAAKEGQIMTRHFSSSKPVKARLQMIGSEGVFTTSPSSFSSSSGTPPVRRNRATTFSKSSSPNSAPPAPHHGKRTPGHNNNTSGNNTREATSQARFPANGQSTTNKTLDATNAPDGEAESVVGDEAEKKSSREPQRVARIGGAAKSSDSAVMINNMPTTPPAVGSLKVSDQDIKEVAEEEVVGEEEAAVLAVAAC